MKIKKFGMNVISAFVFSKRLRHIVRDGFLGQYFKQYFTVKRDIAAEKDRKFKHQLAFAAIVKNEAPYILEWIEYHLLVGVEKFYIYDNESTDNLKELLNPYIKSGIVEYTYWEGRGQQRPVYNNALQKYKYDTKWLGFVDIDEFVVPIAGDSLKDILKDYEGYAGLSAHWVIYGDSGHKTKTDDLVIERFTKRASDDFTRNMEVKTIVNPRFVIGMDAHKPYVFKKYDAVDENYRKIFSHKNNPFTANKIRINHYYGKSYEEFQLKKLRGRTLSTTSAYFDDYFSSNNRNDVEDNIMEKYVAAIKERIEKCQR